MPDQDGDSRAAAKSVRQTRGCPQCDSPLRVSVAVPVCEGSVSRDGLLAGGGQRVRVLVFVLMRTTCNNNSTLMLHS